MRALLLSLFLFWSPLLKAQQSELVVEGHGSGVTAAALHEIRGRVEKGLRKLTPHFPGTPAASIRVVVHRRRATMPAQVRERLHPGSPGLAFLGRSEIHVLLGAMLMAPPDDLGTVIDHELVHVLLDQFAGPAGPHIPIWLHEGVAQHLSEAAFLSAKEDTVAFRVRTRTHHRFSNIAKSFPNNDDAALRLAYAQSLSFVSFMVDEIGLPKLLEVAQACRQDVSFPAAFYRITDKPLLSHEERWAEYIVHGSGAVQRFFGANCFAFLTVPAVLLLAIAVARRLNRDHRLGKAMAEQERQAEVFRQRELEEAAARQAAQDTYEGVGFEDDAFDDPDPFDDDRWRPNNGLGPATR